MAGAAADLTGSVTQETLHDTIFERMKANNSKTTSWF